MAEGFKHKPITTYLITGIWTDHQNQPSHYCVHQHIDPGISGGKKMSKTDVMDLIEIKQKSVYTWKWDYEKGRFSNGEKVIVKGTKLFTEPFSECTKDLRHLVKLDWFENLK